MRPLRWRGDSLDELSAFPKDVKRAFGYALREVQKGKTPKDAKPLAALLGRLELRDS
jgi:phage-related protein